MTLALSPGARALWTDYKHQLRQALQNLEEAEIEEILDDLDQHLESASDVDSGELNSHDLEIIITGLGSPEAVAAGASIDTPVGSHDATPVQYGLAYSSLLLLLLALFLPELALASVIAAGLLARVVLQQAGIQVTSLRFTLLPALLINYVLLAVSLFLWPLGLVLPFAAPGGFVAAELSARADAAGLGNTAYWSLAWAAAMLAAGMWILLLGAFSGRLNRLGRLLFYPFWSERLSLNARGFRLFSLGLVITALLIIAAVALI